MVTLFVPDLPEFAALVEASKKSSACRVHSPRSGYWRIEAENELHFNRKALGLKPALWNSALSGGFLGRILEYGRDDLRIGSEEP
jgi:hypothetical protein